MKDIAIQEILNKEKARQKKVINLIASENYVSTDVLKMLGSEFTDKYAEGYPGHRYYGGNKYVDEIENLCKQRALYVFGLDTKDWSVNVQALSGSQANLAVYLALLERDSKIMGMSLDHGGHLTHGYKVSFTGKYFKSVSFGVEKNTEVLDYDNIQKIVLSEKPDLIIVGFTAYSRIIDWSRFRKIAESVGAFLHIDMSHVAGLVAGGVYPSPFPFADTVMTTTHKTLRGPRSALIFSKIDARNLGKKIDHSVFPGLQGGPHINQIAAVATALYEAMQPDFKTYASQVIKNAKTLSDQLKYLGWRIVSGGTDTHLMLVDTWSRGISGKVASDLLESFGIVVNKNTIPFDTLSPSDPSGIRIGTAAETTRGKTVKDMIEIADKINTILSDYIKNKTKDRL